MDVNRISALGGVARVPDPDVVLSDEEVRSRVFAALDNLDPDWRTHLAEAE